MIRAVIFDFDGVIADSEPLHFAAFRDVLAQEALVLTTQEYYERYLGYDDAGVFRAVSNDRRLMWTADRIADLVRRKGVHFNAIERDVSTLFPGAESLIRRLAATLPLAIASGARRAEICDLLERANLARCFGAIVGAEDVGASKPAPDPYLRAVGLLSTAVGYPLDPATCVAVEDSRWGLESARSAGLRTVAVTHSYTAADLASADLVIATLDALDLETLGSIVTS